MNVNKGLVATIGIAVLVLVGMACGSTPASPPEPTIFFPRGQMEAETGARVVMEALLFGELVEVEGCLRIKDGVTSRLLI